jgi:2-amino-4-hydroxy-6-hydroxymethyldihydropteridine diphosphokinase
MIGKSRRRSIDRYLVLFAASMVSHTLARNSAKLSVRHQRRNLSGGVCRAITTSRLSCHTFAEAESHDRFGQRMFGKPFSAERTTRSLGSTSTATEPYATNPSKAASNYKYSVYLAVGSNLGDRYANIRQALDVLCSDAVVATVVRTSFLHETAPLYVTDQPPFLNGVVELYTNLEPLDLLRLIKTVELSLGRDISDKAPRNSPRPVDLDILSYQVGTNSGENNEMMIVSSPELTVPHPRIAERDFVLIPLVEVAGADLVLPGLNGTIGDAMRNLYQITSSSLPEGHKPVRVLPLPRGRMLYLNETIIMGVLNATPDSFSDGGKWTTSVDAAVERALTMEAQGADIIDIGGESTRPGAKEVDIDEELRRTIPIIVGIRQSTLLNNLKCFSVGKTLNASIASSTQNLTFRFRSILDTQLSQGMPLKLAPTL